MTQRILTIIGARPQFIKASVVSLALRKSASIREILLHTGQHFDANMSDIFFRDLGIPEPDIRLDIHGGPHGRMTGRMLEEIEKVLLAEKPDRVMVYGDTNSTLAGALAASKLHIPIAHVEAGLRSFDRRMPEEINRLMADQLSDILFCPTDAAIANLEKEGMAADGFHEIMKVGDVMQDAAYLFGKLARPPEGTKLPEAFVLATFHRAENTDDPERLAAIVSALNAIQQECPVVLPLHPRTRAAIDKAGLALTVEAIAPVGYLEMLWLLQNCRLVATDSGGVQKEAFFHGKPCVTLRDTTEWIELLDIGANVLAGANRERILSEVANRSGRRVDNTADLYGAGHASQRIAARLAG